MPEIKEQPENLKKGSGYFARSPEIAKEAQIKSAESKKRNKKFREIIQEILKLKAPKKIQKAIKEHFPDLEDDINNAEAISLRAVLDAQSGKSKQLKIITDIIDGMPKQNIQVDGDLSFSKKLDDLEKSIDEKTIEKVKAALQDD